MYIPVFVGQTTMFVIKNTSLTIIGQTTTFFWLINSPLLPLYQLYLCSWWLDPLCFQIVFLLYNHYWLPVVSVFTICHIVFQSLPFSLCFQTFSGCILIMYFVLLSIFYTCPESFILSLWYLYQYLPLVLLFTSVYSLVFPTNSPWFRIFIWYPYCIPRVFLLFSYVFLSWLSQQTPVPGSEVRRLGL